MGVSERNEPSLREAFEQPDRQLVHFLLVDLQGDHFRNRRQCPEENAHGQRDARVPGPALGFRELAGLQLVNQCLDRLGLAGGALDYASLKVFEHQLVCFRLDLVPCPSPGLPGPGEIEGLPPDTRGQAS